MMGQERIAGFDRDGHVLDLAENHRYLWVI
jgi:hypothetical protein